MTYKKLSILTIIFVFLIVSGFGCKGLDQEQQAAIRPIVINYWTVFNDITQLESFATQYKTLRPYVTVNIRQVRYDEFDRLFTNALADDVAPDIVSMHVHWLRKNQNRLLTAPSAVKMARIFKKNEWTDEREVVIDTIPLPSVRDLKASYVNTVNSDVVINNQIYGFPLSVDALGIFYNRDILDRAGVPEAPTNWSQFVDAVQKTTKFSSQGTIVQSGTALGTGFNIDAAFDLVSLFMGQSGTNIASGGVIHFTDGFKDSDRSHPTFRALDFYTDFARQTKEVYSWNEQKPNALDEFVRGKMAFYFGYAYNFPTIKARAPQMNLETIPMFQLNPDNPSNVANYWVESVVKKTTHPNEAWDFVRFITSPENVKKYTTATFRPSPLRSQIAVQQQDENMEPFATQALFAENWYRCRDVDIARNAFQNMVSDLLKPYGEMEPLDRDKQIIINTAARVQQTM